MWRVFAFSGGDAKPDGTATPGRQPVRSARPKLQVVESFAISLDQNEAAICAALTLLRGSVRARATAPGQRGLKGCGLTF